MAIRLTLTKTTKGDLEMHKAGCADLKVRARHHSDFENEHYAGADLLQVIEAADNDMASWFCEEPYTDEAVEQGCWTTSIVTHAPCFVSLLREARVEFDSRTGRPSYRPLGRAGAKSYETVVAEARSARVSARKAGRSQAAAAASVVVGACRGKWSRCGGANPAKSESWHLCQACTDARKDGMKAG